ncbi:replication initiator protein A [Acidaminobacter sp. JC074]|uniref:DUF6017 domain-containing protein n=1 Tax=Acidaminobacter sp. JC074 TaxID=2530199 RepID=UPI001F0F74B5|nr:DUF6017 domain-containing protein [Acidaminobacter sp. JC074]MCH4888949.1 replication initiator protein A [Acidaminobacter sp. JC074]
MAGLKLDYYYGNESEQFTFFRIPKVLFTDNRFRKLSAESKVLYGMLLDRMALSRANGWLDKENRVYIIFTVEEIQENLNCSKQKAVNMMAELDDKKGIGLIEKKRQGLGRPNIIYVKNFILGNTGSLENTGEFQKSKNHTSEGLNNRLQEVHKLDFKESNNHISVGQENRLQEVPNLDPNNTNYNHTEFNHIQSNLKTDDGQDEINQYLEYEKLIKANIEYNVVYVYDKINLKDVDNIVGVMCDVLCTPREDTIRVNGVALPGDIVKQRFLEIRQKHIDYILDCMNENPSKIKNIRAYLITTIFNAPSTIDQYYRSRVNHDMYGSR